eukprot:GSChrysophyteH1.ASY1.ANO1.455.1 assembled CDS
MDSEEREKKNRGLARARDIIDLTTTSTSLSTTSSAQIKRRRVGECEKAQDTGIEDFDKKQKSCGYVVDTHHADQIVTDPCEISRQNRDLMSQKSVKWQPFYLMKSRNVMEPYNHNCLDLGDLFRSEPDNSIEEVVLVNFVFDLSYIYKELHMICEGNCPVLLLHGEKETHGKWLQEATKQNSTLRGALCRPFFSWRFVQVHLPGEAFGTHHSKICIIFFENGIRVCIHTANLREGDHHNMTNGLFVQDFPKKIRSATSPGICKFEEDLCAYFRSYTLDTTTLANMEMRQYDFSSAEVTLVPSVPGRHKINRAGSSHVSSVSTQGSHRQQFGYLAVQKKMQYLEVNESMSEGIGKGTAETCDADNDWIQDSKLRIIFPTVGSIRSSVGGYSQANSIPVRAENLLSGNDTLLPYYAKTLCIYDGTVSGRHNLPPHIKTYSQFRSINYGHLTELLWFILTSSNLSQAAWGVLQSPSKGPKLYIKSYEMGVLFCPQDTKTLCRTFSCTPNHPVLGLDRECNTKCSSCDGSEVSSDLHTRFFAKKSCTDVSTVSRGAGSTINMVFFPVPYSLSAKPYNHGAKADVPWTVNTPQPYPDFSKN